MATHTRRLICVTPRNFLVQGRTSRKNSSGFAAILEDREKWRRCKKANHIVTNEILTKNRYTLEGTEQLKAGI
jgi:hypothetical protein